MSIDTRLSRVRFLAVLLMLTSASAFAVDEIVVTATKRASTIQDVPFSVNAQTEQDIQRSGAQNIEDISRNVAGLSIQNLGPGQSQVAVRGVSAGQIVRDQPGVKEQVGIYLDESVISLSLFTPDLDLFDLNRVETLRGPQGTLFGSGSVGGTVRYITNQPQLGKTEGLVETEVNLIDDGGFGGHGKGMVNVPLTDKMALRAVAYYTGYGGFIDALKEGGGKKTNVNGGERGGVRVALRYEPTSDISITPRVVYQRVGTDGFNRQEVFNLFANNFTTTRPKVVFKERQQFLLLDEEFRDDTLLTDLTIDAKLGSIDLTSITSYTNRDILASRDASALTGSISISPFQGSDFLLSPAAVLLPSNLLDTTKVNQITQEARASGNVFQGDSLAIDWLAGVFYSDTKRHYAQRLPTPGYDALIDAAPGAKLGPGTSAAVANGYGPDSPYNSDLPYDIEQVAVFTEWNFDIFKQFRITAGGRYYNFDENRTFRSGGIFSADNNQTDKTSSDGFTPRVLLRYELNDAVSFNAQASRGFRLGGVNDPLNLPICTPQDRVIFGSYQRYKDETLWNYEGGVKVNTDIITFNAAVYHSDISDLQATLDAGSCSSRIVFNVPKAHTTGGEFEVTARPVQGLELAFSGSLVQAEFDSTVRDGTGAVIGGLQDGNRLPSVPRFQFAAGATYSWPMNIASRSAEAYVSLSDQYVGDRYTQPSDQVPGAGNFVSNLPFGGAPGTDVTSVDLKLDSYNILNLNAGLDFDKWSLLAYVNNLTDENAQLAFDRERGGRARLGFHVNQPRTFGVGARFKF
jgi:iron complex outermembrane receptor protein